MKCYWVVVALVAAGAGSYARPTALSIRLSRRSWPSESILFMSRIGQQGHYSGLFKVFMNSHIDRLGTHLVWQGVS